MRQHTVLSGETMEIIAKKYGIGINALIRANPQISNPSLIFVNNVLNIPTGSNEEISNVNRNIGQTVEMNVPNVNNRRPEKG